MVWRAYKSIDPSNEGRASSSGSYCSLPVPLEFQFTRYLQCFPLAVWMCVYAQFTQFFWFFDVGFGVGLANLQIHNMLINIEEDGFVCAQGSLVKQIENIS